MKRGKVVFVEERSVREELKKTRRFLPILSYFARVYGKEIQVDAPHGKPLPPTPNEENTVYIHFFSFPGDENSTRRLGFANLLYTFPVPTDDLGVISSEFHPAIVTITKNDVGARFFSDINARFILRSQEGRAVIEMIDGHLYILFDIAHREWDGEEVVLWWMLIKAFSRLCPKDYSEALAREIVLKDSIRRTLKRGSADNFRQLFLTGVNQRLMELQREKNEKERRYREQLEEFIRLSLRVDEFEARAALPHEEMSLEKTSKEFDKIMAMAGVLGIKVGEELGRKSLVIYTKPLALKNFPALWIGQFKIVISQDVQSSGMVVLVGEWGWQGPYYHPHSRIRSSRLETPCWGQAISPSITKALANCDIPSIVHLTLAFLTLHENLPDPRNLRNPSQRTKVGEKDFPPEPSPLFSSESELRQARDSYIDFVRDFKERFLRQSLGRELEEFGRRQRVAVSEATIILKTLTDLASSEAHWEAVISSDLPEKEAEKLLADPDLLYLLSGKDWIFAVFGSGQGYKWFQDTIMPSVGILVKLGEIRPFVISLGDHHPCRKQGVQVTQDAWVLKINSEGRVNFSSEGQRIFSRLLARGRLGTILLALRDILFGKRKDLEDSLLREDKKDSDEPSEGDVQWPGGF